MFQYVSNTLLGKWRKITESWEEHRQEVNVHSWDEYFMMIAIVTASKSKDAQTQYGAVFVKDKKIIATGYNSFPRHMPDWMLPNLRPMKYPWMIHSEINALCNATENVAGSTCYVNGHPCFDCMKTLYQAGIKRYVVTKGKANMMESYSDEMKANYELLVDTGDIRIKEIELRPDCFDRTLEIFGKSN